LIWRGGLFTPLQMAIYINDPGLAVNLNRHF
jgi:hypothetical protein